MKVAVVGSRGLRISNISKYIPEGTTEIISGGAMGVDSLAAEYAYENCLEFTEFLPNYEWYGGKAATLRRNLQIIDNCDILVALWDGVSRGTKFTIDNAKKRGKEVNVHIFE